MTDWHDQPQGVQSLVGRWDPEARLYIATGWVYGPAGPASMRIAPGLRVSFDFAEPGQLSEVVVEAPLNGDPRDLDASTRTALRNVLGAVTTDGLLATALRPNGRPVRIGSFGVARFRGPDELGRAALAVELSTDANLSPTGRAAAALEAAHIAATSGAYGDVLARVTAELVAEAATAFAELDGDDLVVGYGAAARLNEMRDDLARSHDAARAWPRFEEPRDETIAAASIPAPVAVAVPAPAMPSVAALTFRTPTEVVIRAPQATEATWARVHRRNDNALLGLAPFRAEDGYLRALIVIPPGLTEPDIRFDLTEDPATTPSFSVQQVRRAVALGRDACRAERLGDQFTASDRWRECSTAWATAGDESRAEQAIARSRGTGPRRGTPRPRTTAPPLAADLL